MGRKKSAFSQEKNKEKLLFGISNKMKAIDDVINRISDTDVPVLISGESGVGKELVANSIHSQSLRKNKALIKVNCVALPGELLESELFGYERGAFTSAYQTKPGRFEFAHEGTMFLDEIGDMPQPLQAKLLRVLQEGEFFRLGGKNEIRVDTRVIAATNRELEVMVRDGLFREDLFHRLNVIRIHIPPLRERKEEILRLLTHFLKKYSREYNRTVNNLTEDSKSKLLDYTWPGNVRELENIAKKIVVLGDEESVISDLIENKNIEENDADEKKLEVYRYDESCSLKEIGKRAALDAEKKAIKTILEQTRWNRSHAAKILKISYKTLLYKIKECGLNKGI